MIQATGTITLSDGVTQFKDPLININFGSSNKHLPTYAYAEIGEEKVIQERYSTHENVMVPNPQYIPENGMDESAGILPEIEVIKPKVNIKEIKFFEVKHILLSKSYNEPKPSFETVQDFLLAKLKDAYPTINFQII